MSTSRELFEIIRNENARKRDYDLCARSLSFVVTYFVPYKWFCYECESQAFKQALINPTRLPPCRCEVIAIAGRIIRMLYSMINNVRNIGQFHV